MNRIYGMPNSFGRTYAELRAFLELSEEEHFEVYKYAKAKGLDFVESLCANRSLAYDYFNLNVDDKLKFFVHFDEIENN